jgi:hypothetical protein
MTMMSEGYLVAVSCFYDLSFCLDPSAASNEYENRTEANFTEADGNAFIASLTKVSGQK